jgi:hypothetical protein
MEPGMRWQLVATCLFSTALVSGPSTAWATETDAEAEAKPNVFYTQVNEAHKAIQKQDDVVQGAIDEQGATTSSASGDASTPVTSVVMTVEAEDHCESLNAGGCVSVYHCENGQVARTYYLFGANGESLGQYYQCPSDPPPPASATPAGTAEAPPRVTPAMVLTAFEEVPLPESEILIQPTEGETIVNNPTNLATNAEAFDETVSFFGGRITVVLHITPSTFTWHHGDGTTQTTDRPGRLVKQFTTDTTGLIVHAYTQKATDMPVSVDTTWTATWTLNGTDMGEVPGTVTIGGDSTPLDALEAPPVLVN